MCTHKRVGSHRVQEPSVNKVDNFINLLGNTVLSVSFLEMNWELIPSRQCIKWLFNLHKGFIRQTVSNKTNNKKEMQKPQNIFKGIFLICFLRWLNKKQTGKQIRSYEVLPNSLRLSIPFYTWRQDAEILQRASQNIK